MLMLTDLSECQKQLTTVLIDSPEIEMLFSQDIMLWSTVCRQ